MCGCLKRTHSPIIVVDLGYFSIVVGADYRPSLGEFDLEKNLFYFDLFCWQRLGILTPLTLIWNRTGVADKM